MREIVRHHGARLLARFPGTLALAAGAAAATGFAPLDLWPITLAALALFLRLLGDAGGPWRAAWTGWLFGLGQFTLGLNWIATAFTYQEAMPAWLGWVAVVLLSLFLALYSALAAGVAWWVTVRVAASGPAPRRSAAGLALMLAAFWIVAEWLRAVVFTGFAWNPLAAIWAPVLGMRMLAALVGTYGLSGITILLAGGLLWGSRRLLAGERPLATAAVLVVPAALVLGLVPALFPAPAAPGSGVRMRIVQPNISQQDKWRDAFQEETWRRLSTLTGAPGAEPRIIFWPEVAIPDYLEVEPWARARIGQLLGPRDLLLTGAIALETDGDRITAARNSLFALGSGGHILGRYDKAHLVPYGEYLPMRPLLSALGLSRLAPGDFDFLPGPGPRNLMLPGIGPAGVQICYEVIFSGQVVDPQARPRLLFNPSNDAWFGRWGPPQHLAQARLRAAEEGLPVIRSTPTGISAVIDAHGRLLAALPWRVAGAIDARLPAAHAPTPFARFGNALAFLFAGLLAAVAIAVARRTR